MDIQAVLKELRDNIAAMVTKRDEELKAFGKVSDETKAEIKKLNDTYEKSLGDINERMSKLEASGNRKGMQAFGETVRKTFGQMFVDSEEYKAAKEQGLKSVNRVDVKSFFRKDITSATGSAGSAIEPMRVPGIITPAERGLTIRDLLAYGTTTSNAIEYVRESGFTNNAGPQGTGPNGELQAKNKSDLVLTLETANVRTLAHYVIASRQVLDDASMLQSYIDARLLYGLMLVEENQLLFGDGTNQNLEGITQVASVYDDQYETLVVGGVTRIDKIRLAILQARLAEYPVDAVVLNPVDWAAIELTKDGEQRYIWVNVSTGAEPRLWRIAVVETTAMPEGEFLVGAFRLGAQLWDREQANIRVAEQHADLFIKNGVAILAEERLALAIYRPEAFVYGEFDAPTA